MDIKCLFCLTLTMALLNGFAQKVLQKRQAPCNVYSYNETFYTMGNIYGENKFVKAQSLEECAHRCQNTSGCTAVNFSEEESACAFLSEGMRSSEIVKPGSYMQLAGWVHAYISCGQPDSEITEVGILSKLTKPKPTSTQKPQPTTKSTTTRTTTSTTTTTRKPTTKTTKQPLVQPSSKVTGSVGCGKQSSLYRPTIGRNRIIGGSEAAQHSWPWLITMTLDLGDGYGSLCGGTLLRVKDNVEQSDIVLTAAHCVVKEETMSTSPEAHPAEKLSVIAGNHYTNRWDPTEQSSTGDAVRFHPNFLFTSRTGANNDVALVKLETPIKFNDAVRPICLPKSATDSPLGKTCVAAGWGRNSSLNEEEMPSALQQTIAEPHDADTCKRGWGNIYIEDEMVCAGSLTGSSGTCQGDSGGTLACQQSDGSWTVYGATSFGISGTCLAAGKPSVFTRISAYLDWIKTNMKQMSTL